MTMVTRRSFLTTTAAAGLAARASAAPQPAANAPALKFRLGIVTYNIAATWDIPTMLKICRAVGLSPVELHGRGTDHPPHIATMMRRADHPRVGVTWNSNAADVVKGSVAEYFKLLRPWIKSCHINELHSGYPYRELFRLLRETGYDRVTLCEIQGMPDIPTGERLMRYYKALWTELTRA